VSRIKGYRSRARKGRPSIGLRRRRDRHKARMHRWAWYDEDYTLILPDGRRV